VPRSPVRSPAGAKICVTAIGEASALSPARRQNGYADLDLSGRRSGGLVSSASAAVSATTAPFSARPRRPPPDVAAIARPRCLARVKSPADQGRAPPGKPHSSGPSGVTPLRRDHEAIVMIAAIMDVQPHDRRESPLARSPLASRAAVLHSGRWDRGGDLWVDGGGDRRFRDGAPRNTPHGLARTPIMPCRCAYAISEMGARWLASAGRRGRTAARSPGGTAPDRDGSTPRQKLTMTKAAPIGRDHDVSFMIDMVKKIN